MGKRSFPDIFGIARFFSVAFQDILLCTRKIHWSQEVVSWHLIYIVIPALDVIRGYVADVNVFARFFRGRNWNFYVVSVMQIGRRAVK